MTKVTFQSSEMFQERVARLFSKIKRQLLKIFPDADIQDMGSTAIAGLLTKGDLDINLRVKEADFSQAVAYLKNYFPVHQKENWADGFASFLDEASYDLPLGIHVTIKGHKADKFINQINKLRANPDLVKKYNELKKKYEGSDIEAYRKAKWRFIEQHLEPS